MSKIVFKSVPIIVPYESSLKNDSKSAQNTRKNGSGFPTQTFRALLLP